MSCAAVATTIGFWAPHFFMNSRPSSFSRIYIWLNAVPAAESWMTSLPPANSGLSMSAQDFGALSGARKFLL